MAERPQSIAGRAELAEAGRHSGAGGARVVAVRSAAARSARKRSDGSRAGKKPHGGGAGAQRGSSKRGAKKASRTSGQVRSASASSAGKASKGGTKKAGKKAPAKAARKSPAKKAGSRPVGKKTAAKKPPAKKSPAKPARKGTARKPEKRAGAQKAVKTPRKAASGAAKKTPARPPKAPRKAAAKKTAKRAPAKKATKAAARKTAKAAAPPRPPRKAAPAKIPPGAEAAPARAPRVAHGAEDAAATAAALVAPPRSAEPARRRKAADASAPRGEPGLPDVAGGERPEGAPAAGVPPAPTPRRARGEAGARKRRKPARFDTEPEVRKKKRARLEKMRRAGIFGVPGARPRRLRKRKVRDEMVRPSPPLEKTDPLKHYLAGEMVPCPVGCGGFSEVVRVSTMESGAGEIWFECLSCAQRKMFEIPPATVAEEKAIFAELEAGHEPLCPRHTKAVPLRRRGRDFVCPECGVRFAEP